MIDLLELSADVRATDGDASAAVRAQARPGTGRLAELAAWLATATGPPERVRLVVLGEMAESVAALAAGAEVGVRELAAADGPEAAFAAGVAAADDEVEAGAGLLVLAGGDAPLGAGAPAPAVVVALLTGAEPVALLPRGAAAVDSAAWIERAVRLRDARRAVAALRHAPGELLTTLDSPALAAATGFLLRAVARRTPLLLDGAVALAAALLAREVQPRTAHWWQVADTSPDPVPTRAVDHLEQRPLLDLGAGSGQGVAGLLAVSVLRCAAALHLDEGRAADE